MQPLPHRTSRFTRLTLVALALFVLLAVVAFASRSGFGGSSDARPSPAYVSWAFSIFLVVFVLAIPVAVYAHFLRGQAAALERSRSFKRIVLQNVLVLGFVLVVASVLVYARHLHPSFLGGRSPLDTAPLDAPGKGGKKDGIEPVFKTPVLYVAIPLVLALLVTGFVLHRRRLAPARGEAPARPLRPRGGAGGRDHRRDRRPRGGARRAPCGDRCVRADGGCARTPRAPAPPERDAVRVPRPHPARPACAGRRGAAADGRLRAREVQPPRDRRRAQARGDRRTGRRPRRPPGGCRVRRHAVDLTVIFVLSTIVAAYVALAQPGVRDIAIHVYVLVIGALLMFGLVTSTKEALPRRAGSELERALAERRVSERRLPELERSEREVTLATASAYDLHFRLLPHLRAVAAARLVRRGLRLAPEHVGRWWDLLRPDREAPEEHFGGGIAERDLRALVDDLERM